MISWAFEAASQQINADSAVLRLPLIPGVQIRASTHMHAIYSRSQRRDTRVLRFLSML